MQNNEYLIFVSYKNGPEYYFFKLMNVFYLKFIERGLAENVQNSGFDNSHGRINKCT